jgi:hypothetical protein
MADGLFLRDRCVHIMEFKQSLHAKLGVEHIGLDC